VTVFFSSLAFAALLRICAFAFAFCFVAPQAPDLSVRKTIGLSIVFDFNSLPMPTLERKLVGPWSAAARAWMWYFLLPVAR